MFKTQLSGIGSHIANFRSVYRLKAGTSLVLQQNWQKGKFYSTSDSDCPELPSKPSWSLNSIMERRDAIHISSDHSQDFTPETISHLLELSHLSKPKDPQVLERLERDVRRMRNFLNYIQASNMEKHGVASVETLRSLVDDGEGLRLRSNPAEVSNPEEIVKEEQESIRRRDVLLKSPKRTKGNFFVVGTELDPKQQN
ncbi:hypothetical protein BGZ76_006736 [Entomortierella beljakovae]|nr:hypothetical protein BGZ76_006736 [Entomortierella beljakovae]